MATYTAGQKLTAAALETLVSAWTAYTPTFGGTLGNGTIAGRYKLIGKTAHFNVTFTFGSTSVLGNGSFTLPVNRRVTGGDGEVFIGTAFDTSATGYFTLVSQPVTTSTIQPRHVIATANPAITSAVPFTWATGDIMRFQGTYETV